MLVARAIGGVTLAALALMLGSCSRTETVMMRVAPYKSGCMGMTPGWCAVISQDGRAPDSGHPSIDGLRYQWGHEYWLIVRVRHLEPVPADGSSIEYTVKDVLDVRPVAAGTPFETYVIASLLEDFDPQTGEGTLDSGGKRYVVPSTELRGVVEAFLPRGFAWGRARFRFGDDIDGPLVLEALEFEGSSP